MKKYVVFLGLLVTLVPSLVFANESIYFPDVTASTAYIEAVDGLKQLGIVDGYPDGTFGPARNINRAEFAKIVVNAKFKDELATYTPSNCFPDVKASDWFAKYVCFAKDQGIIGGYPDGTFKPANNINSMEAIKIEFETLLPEYINVNFASDNNIWYEKYYWPTLKLGNYPIEWEQDESRPIKRIEMAYSLWMSLDVFNNLSTYGRYKIDDCSQYTQGETRNVYHDVTPGFGDINVVFQETGFSQKYYTCVSVYEVNAVSLSTGTALRGYRAYDEQTNQFIDEANYETQLNDYTEKYEMKGN